MMSELSLYIHFPFCLRKCRYCDFYSVPFNSVRVNEWLDALSGEIELWQAEYGGSTVKTLYLGGGSPNLLSSTQFIRLLDSLKAAFNMWELAEFTVETNPVRHDREFLNLLKNNGVTRLNVGVQSFNDDELRTLGRIHGIEEVAGMFENLEAVGFAHVGLDLIYGIPGQTRASWRDSLYHALNTGVEHLSLYNLTYEEGTPLYNLLRQNKVRPVDHDIEREMYLEACQQLREHGYHHYEISNWAKPGCESRHNRAYWEGKSYLGLGPAAHSYNGKSRWWNVRSVQKYVEIIDAGQLPVAQREELTEQEREIEYLFLRLRTSEGLSRSRFENFFRIDFDRIINRLNKLNLDTEYWIFDGRGFKLTPGGWFVSDTIISGILNIIEELRGDYKKD